MANASCLYAALFQSTPLYKVRRWVDAAGGWVNQFQSTPLYKVRPAGRERRASFVSFQSTPLYKVRPGCRARSSVVVKFQSTPLYKVRRDRPTMYLPAYGVSIHAPIQGAALR